MNKNLDKKSLLPPIQNVASNEYITYVKDKHAGAKKFIEILGEEDFFDQDVPLHIDLQSLNGKKEYDAYLLHQENIFKERVNELLYPIVQLYREGTFNQKKEIIDFLNRVYVAAPLANAYITSNSVFEMGKNILSFESLPGGNHFLMLFIKSLFEQNTHIIEMDTEIAPDTFITKRNGKLMINNVDQVGQVKDLQRQIMIDEKSLELIDNILEKENTRIDKNGNISVGIDYTSKDPNVVKYNKVRDELYQKNKELNAYFSKNLDEEISKINPTTDHELDVSVEFLLNNHVRDYFKLYTGIDLSQIPVKFQYYLGSFIKNITNSQSEEIYNFFKDFGQNGIKTFLSLEHGGHDMGQHILDLGEQLPIDIASKVFEKYAEIIDSVEKILNIAQNNFKTTIDTKPELLQSVEQSLYKRGAKLLSQFHENINQNPGETIAELERINADTITTLSIFKYAVKFGDKLPLEDISGAEFSKRIGNEFSSAEIDEMEHIYQTNWKNYGNQELIQSVIKKFKESLQGDHAEHEEVYLFKKNDQINAFVKFSELQPGVKYASALNVDQSSKGFGLGEAMMDEALYREAQENILVATCDPTNESNMRYFEKGFVGTGFTGDNPPVLNICWNEEKNRSITSKQMKRDDLVMMYLKQQVPHNMIIKKDKTLESLHIGIPSGKALTRCFRDPLHTGDWYAVYETISNDYEYNNKTTT